jgi:RNase adaptor protein for sRNA GlmZ degradation
VRDSHADNHLLMRPAWGKELTMTKEAFIERCGLRSEADLTRVLQPIKQMFYQYALSEFKGPQDKGIHDFLKTHRAETESVIDVYMLLNWFHSWLEHIDWLPIPEDETNDQESASSCHG